MRFSAPLSLFLYFSTRMQCFRERHQDITDSQGALLLHYAPHSLGSGVETIYSYGESCVGIICMRIYTFFFLQKEEYHFLCRVHTLRASSHYIPRHSGCGAAKEKRGPVH